MRSFRHIGLEGFSVPTHFHRLGELMCFRNIAGQISVNSQVIELSDAMLVYFPPLSLHSMDVTGSDREYSLLQFEPSLVRELKVSQQAWFSEQPLILKLDADELELVTQQLRWLELRQNQVQTSHALNMSLLRTLFEFLVAQRQRSLEVMPGSAEQPGYRGFSQILPLLEFIEERQLLSLPLEQAAEICQLSKYHFSRLFKSVFGHNFKDYMMRRRINQALLMLDDRSLSIADIAYACEFSDSAHFCAKFRQIMGISPGQLRRSRAIVSEF
ncbi:AraC family transcriptional regulator [Aliagarivorans marinus]|uniref:AraC family transcriptional regulator n=1 Tax=Aliagarivorans marinus TaxID=561965 RepID=UPI00146F9AB8|nr:helix-turn-helix domain-containing protein [Aliagarivorans marinus]